MRGAKCSPCKRFQPVKRRSTAPISMAESGGGGSLHAGVSVNTRERKKLEHICRYISRPALSEARLELTDQGMVRYALKTAYRDGTTHVVFERGGLPPNSRYRDRITTTRAVKVKKSTDEETDGGEDPDQAEGKRKGMCCTLKGIKSQRLKRFSNGPPRY
jgi:hypothetical protein